MANHKVCFYSLKQKFVDNQSHIPDDAKQVMYYSMSIGHHVGVIDCFKAVLNCPLEGYKHWINQLPDGEAKRKMSGLLKFGEIMIDINHINMLANAFSQIAPSLDEPYQQWTETLMSLLNDIKQEPVIYLMVKQLNDYSY